MMQLNDILYRQNQINRINGINSLFLFSLALHRPILWPRCHHIVVLLSPTKHRPQLNANVEEIAERMPPLLAQHLSAINNSSSLTNPASSKRITSLNFVKISYFDDTGIRALQCLDLIYLKDNTYKATFYQNLRNVLDLIPKVSQMLELSYST